MKRFFEQDIAPAHSALHTKEWFFDNVIAVLDWPAKSPDINIIEKGLGMASSPRISGKEAV